MQTAWRLLGESSVATTPTSIRISFAFLMRRACQRGSSRGWNRIEAMTRRGWSRLLTYVSPEQGDELAFFQEVGFRELTRTKRGWVRHV
jgi:hypothetical protein